MILFKKHIEINAKIAYIKEISKEIDYLYEQKYILYKNIDKENQEDKFDIPLLEAKVNIRQSILGGILKSL